MFRYDARKTMRAIPTNKKILFFVFFFSYPSFHPLPLQPIPSSPTIQAHKEKGGSYWR